MTARTSESVPQPIRLTEKLRPGIQFTEKMTGYFSTNVTDTHEGAAARGERDGSRLELTLTIITDDLRQMLEDPDHETTLTGTATAPELSSDPLTITEGTFNLFVVDPGQVETHHMLYRGTLNSKEGRVYYFSGFKVIRNDPGFDAWSDLTTLYVTISRYSGFNPVLGRGILELSLGDFMRQLATIRARNAEHLPERMDTTARFQLFFLGMLRDTYGFTFAKSHYFDPYAPERKKRLLRAHGTVIEGQPYPVQTSDRVDLRLTRYQGGGKGPVILAPGFGMSSLSFSIDTIRPNLVEYLCDHDYDVWLLDYRASRELAASLTQFSIDEIATRDWPAAVDTVRACADAPTVQVVAHCVGAMAFMMGLLAGSLRGTVRSAVCSQMGVHPIGGLLNEIKAGFYFGTALGFLGWERLRVKVDASADWKGRLFDRLLKFYPTDEPCNNPVCRRVWLFLGESFTHTQLDQATHDALHEMFGEVNLRALRHLARILREGQVVNRDGEDAYLPQADRIDIPIHFLHGEENRIFLPEGTEETLDWLRSRNPGRARLYTRTPPIPGYAHLDCFIGKNAWRDVFPLVLEQLDRYA